VGSTLLYLEQRQLQNSLTEELSVKSKTHSRWQWAFGAFGAYQWLKTDAPVYIDGDMNKYLSRRITAIAYNGVLAAMIPGTRLSEEIQNITPGKSGYCVILGPTGTVVAHKNKSVVTDRENLQDANSKEFRLLCR